MPGTEDVATRFDRAAAGYDDDGMHRWLAEKVAGVAGAGARQVRQEDAAAWQRVTGSEFGTPIRQASEPVRDQARARFVQLLTEKIETGQPNTSRAFIVEVEQSR